MTRFALPAGGIIHQLAALGMTDFGARVPRKLIASRREQLPIENPMLSPYPTDPPLVTAIIATYNRGYIVCEAIDSILRQTYPHIEIIVVDDGSTDDTKEILKPYGNRIHLVYQHNQGPATAWNTGIKTGRGSILCFLGSDDLWLPTFVERQVSLLQKAGPSVPCSITNAVARWADGGETRSFDLADLCPKTNEGLWWNVLDVFLTRFVMCGQMFAIRREALEEVGLFDSSLTYLEDYDVALRLALQGPWGYIREPLVIYRQSAKGDSMSIQAQSLRAELADSMLRIRRRVHASMEARRPPLRSRYMTGALMKAKRDRWAARATAGSEFGRKYAFRAYDLMDHYSEAAFRRSPFYPKMQTVPLHACESLQVAS